MEIVLKELREGLKSSRADLAGRIPALERELQDIQSRKERLYEAIETGRLGADDDLEKRLAKLQKRRNAILVDLAGLRKRGELPVTKIGPKLIQHFSDAMRERLLDSAGEFAKGYVAALVERVTVTGNTVHLRGSNARLAEALLAEGSKSGHREVPRLGGIWLPGPDSNQRPID